MAERAAVSPLQGRLEFGAPAQLPDTLHIRAEYNKNLSRAKELQLDQMRLEQDRMSRRRKKRITYRDASKDALKRLNTQWSGILAETVSKIPIGPFNTSYLEQLLKESQDPQELLRGVVHALLSHVQFDTAKKLAQKARDLSPNSPLPYFALYRIERLIEKKEGRKGMGHMTGEERIEEKLKNWAADLGKERKPKARTA